MAKVDFKDYYEVLGVDRQADEKAIRNAFRQRAKDLHPDVNRDNPRAEDEFKDLNEAFEVLSDTEKRRMYDRFGDDWKRYRDAGVSPDEVIRTGRRAPQQEAEDFGTWFMGSDGSFTFEQADANGGRFSDFFNLLFGSQGTGGRVRQATTRPRRGDDLEVAATVTLDEAAIGTRRRLTVRAPELCDLCGGDGVVRGAMCPRCNGTGQSSGTKELEVTIPKGVRTGSRVRISGQGGPGHGGGPKGDVYLVIKVVPHHRFERSGDDLIQSVRIPLYTALLGGEVVVPTLDRSVALTIPSETQAGRQFRLRGKGMPKLGKGDQHGDMIARVEIDLPKDLTDQERDLLDQLRALRK